MKKKANTRFPGVKREPNGRYLVRYKFRDPKTGRLKDCKAVIDAKDAKDAARARLELIEKAEREVERPLTPKLAEYVARSWLPGKRRTLKPSTLARYVQTLDDWIFPTFGQWFIDKIKPSDVARWRDEMAALKDADGNYVCAPGSVNGRLRVLRGVLRDAARDYELLYDPVARVTTIPEPKGRHDDPNRMRPEELRRFFELVREHRPAWYPFFLTLALTGARVGEVTALTWSDIDEARGVIHIRRARWKQHVGTTKTGVEREIPCSEELLEVLRAHRRDLLGRQAKGLEKGLVFPSAKGTMICNPSARNALEKVLEHMELGRRHTLHGFRRTFNNLTRQHVSGDVVRSMTGHVTEAMTVHYSHIEEEEKRSAIAPLVALVPKVEGLVEGPPPDVKTAGAHE